jgi:hypothetical protein
MEPMVWILSILLTFILFVALLAIIFPQLLLPFVAERWKRSFHYRSHTHF